jgi:hypothetical protein
VLQSLIRRLRRSERLHMLHLGKTGGTAVKAALKRHVRRGRYSIKLHPHSVKLCDIHDGEKVFFFVRDPISRFVSAFYSRQRQGRPRYYSPWSPAEERAFATFRTANDLAVALSAPDEQLRSAARSAMTGIQHIRSSCWDWFENEEYFVSRLPSILLIGSQEHLVEDFEHLKLLCDLPAALALPTGEVEAHKNPATIDRSLDDEAQRNLVRWYAADYNFLELCTRLASAHEIPGSIRFRVQKCCHV